MQTSNIKSKKRIRNLFFVVLIIWSLLILRVGFIQFVQGSELQSMAYAQQTLNRKVNPRRGTIWDSTGKKVLAVSASTETVSVNPTNIKKEDKERVSRALSDIFMLDYETILKRVSKNSSIETIAKKVDKEKTDKLRLWMEQNNIESRHKYR